MSSPDTVSVVIPTFKRVTETCSAIQSVINQTRPVDDIIVVDDGPDAHIDGACFTDLDPRVRVIRHPTNLGVSAARNTGIEAAQGDWIAFLDSDDIWLPQKLERQFSAIGGNPERRTTVCVSNCVVRSAEGEHPFNKVAMPANNLTTWILAEDNTIQTSTILIPKSLARVVKFNTNLHRHEDWDFLFRIKDFGGRFLYVDECLSVYNSFSSVNRLSKSDDLIAFQSWLRSLESRGPRRDLMRYYLNHIFYQHRRKSNLSAISQLLSLSLSIPDGLWIIAQHFVKRSLVRYTRLQGKAEMG